MKKKILGSLLKGIGNGFPLLQTIGKLIKKQPGVAAVVAEVANPNAPAEAPKTDYVALVAEIVTAGIIVAVIFGKISIEDAIRLVNLFKGQ